MLISLASRPAKGHDYQQDYSVDDEELYHEDSLSDNDCT
jgi:hypothetical protein